MAGNNNGLIWLGAGALGLYMARKYFLTHTVNTRNMRIKMQGFHVQNDGILALDLKLQNPNSQDFYIRSVIAQVFVNGTKVADVNAFTDNIIKGNSEGVVALSALVIKRAIFQELMSAMRRGHNRVLLQGTMNVNNNSLPIQMEYQS